MRILLDTSVKRAEACTVPKIEMLSVYDIFTKDSLRIQIVPKQCLKTTIFKLDCEYYSTLNQNN